MKYWYQKSMRILQSVLCENDIINYDARAVVDYLKSVNADCLIISGGGVIDHFPNPLPMNKRNKFMKDDQDILKDLCNELHSAGMYIIVRVDFRGVEEERFHQHPDWFARGSDGKPVYSQNRKTYSPCYKSYYATEHAVEFIRHLMGTYNIDGIWENAATFGQLACYCERCREGFRKETGKEIPILPASNTLSDGALLEYYMMPNFDEYRTWKAECADAHLKLLRDTVKSYGEDKAFCAEIFDIYSYALNHMLGSGIDHNNAKRHFDLLVSAVSPDSTFALTRKYNTEYNLVQNGASIIRFSRALRPDRQGVICTGGNGTATRYTTSSLLQKRLWMWEIASMGGGIWYVYFNGQYPSATHDRRNAFGQRDVNTFLMKNTDFLSDSVPVRDVAIYYSYSTRNHLALGKEGSDIFGKAIQGVERVLIEKHIPYGFVISDDDFSLNSLDGIKTLVLPNTTTMSEHEAEIIRGFVRNGGGLIATHQTSLFSPDGKQRKNFALADLFGCDYADEVVTTKFDSYYKIKDKASPVLSGIENTTLILNGGFTAKCRKSGNGNEVVSYIPAIPNQPPENAWRDVMDSEFAGIVTHKFGKGKIVYFANTIDSLCCFNGHEDFTEILGNAIDYVSDGHYLVSTNAYRSVHVNVLIHRAVDGGVDYILSFVNTTGAAMQPIKEVVPVGKFDVKVDKAGKEYYDNAILWGEDMKILDGSDAVVIEVEGLAEFKSICVHMK